MRFCRWTNVSCANAVGDISRRSRPYGFNTIIINLSCQCFGLDSHAVAARVPLPRRGVHTRGVVTQQPSSSVLEYVTEDGRDSTRFTNPLVEAMPTSTERE